MTYLDALASELKQSGIAARRRARILTEFADHLQENPEAELGAPQDLARQFADELGTRLARRVALVAFIGLAVTGVAIAAVLLVGTRIVVLPPGVRQIGFAPRTSSWVLPLFLLAAQVSLASGLLALLRAWRLRRVPVITAADAAILYRRVRVGLLAGLLTAGSAPITGVFPGHGRVYVRTLPVAGICILLLLTMLLFALITGRLRPSRSGPAADLTFDLGTRDPRVTPVRVALLLSVAIFVVLAAAGVAAEDPYDGLARGLLDAAACMTGFIVLGRYLGLRTAS